MERRLVLAREAKLASLLPDAGGRLEASVAGMRAMSGALSKIT